ncbi:hypothetical protein HU200_030034 [Digitaria exilis]|uniref:Uncharacterized protein n=1 Tax=Digitaria exilis TaxID=1010633 RepID=A0A835BT43_9POAL|nr:hypothetical protein HU200_030034 [Digitaria exilis]
MRITLWNDRYKIIKLPAEKQAFEQFDPYLGKSQKGVYCALLSKGWSRFRVWLLNESCGEIEWVLKIDIFCLQAMVEKSPIYDYDDRYNAPWIVNYEKDMSEAGTEDESEWDFESGVVLHETNAKATTRYKEIYFLGFHPYIEIAFFLVSFRRVVSYNFNSSKIQELGILSKVVLESFPYTPCRMGVLSENN